MIPNHDDEYWMNIAFREAEVALRRKEVPIGAVIVKNGNVIGKGSNQIEMLQDPTAHAEIIAITAAGLYACPVSPSFQLQPHR